MVPDALAVASAVGSTMDVASPAQSGGPNASGSNLLSFGAAGFGASFMGGFIPGEALVRGGAAGVDVVLRALCMCEQFVRALHLSNEPQACL